MPSIPVDFELSHTDTGPRTCPANSTTSFDIPAPAGFKALSFSWSGQNQTLIVQTAAITQPDPDAPQRFSASVRNHAAQDQTIRFGFVLLKV